MSPEEQNIVKNLSEPAKRLFYSLSRFEQKRLLKKTKEMALRESKKEKYKEIIKKKFEKKNEMSGGRRSHKNKGSIDGSNGIYFKDHNNHKYSTSNADSLVRGSPRFIRETSTTILECMLLGEKQNEESYNLESEERKLSDFSKREIRKTSGFVSKIARSKFAKSRAKSSIRKKSLRLSYEASRTGFSTAKEVVKKSKDIVSAGFKKAASSPIVWGMLLLVLLIGVIGGTIGVVIGAGGAEAGAESDSGSSYQCQVSGDVEKFRGVVEQTCEKYGIPDYVDVIMAMIQQESGGRGIDVMQSSASGYGEHNPVLTTDESIDAGVHYFSDCLKSSKCKSPSDIKGLSLALQGYNFGNGYISWALDNYGGYTKENAITFSAKMALKLGWFSYGDTLYVQHVLRYYVKNDTTTVRNSEASEILEELEDENEASEEVWKVIYKGASLIGKVTYSMDKRQGDGRANPEYLDCSSFTAWAFHKAGITSIPYSSTTATFISSKSFKDISASELRPGDIGLKSKTAGVGGANHVGIYCGKLKNGTKVWMHCTSSSGTSLTGNDSGAMFGAYTGFTYFRRLKKWDK